MIAEWLFGVIQYQPRQDASPVKLGVALFTGDATLVRLVETPNDVADPARIGMAARALANRLRMEAPKTAEDIRRFASLEANEVVLGDLRSVPRYSSPESVLKTLFLRSIAPSLS